MIVLADLKEWRTLLTKVLKMPRVLLESLMEQMQRVCAFDQWHWASTDFDVFFRSTHSLDSCTIRTFRRTISKSL